MSRPYETLFIYLLEGKPSREDEEKLGDNFLGNWIEGGQSFLFFSHPAGERIIELLDRCPDLKLLDEYRFTYEDWQGGMPEQIRIEDFLILPPWNTGEPDSKRIKIILDPGVVFGNGLHPTTRDSLKALSWACRHRPFYRVLDLGTGTGVLSIAAARLGAEKVMAADLNPLCVKTASRNAGLNNLDHVIQVIKAKAEDLAHELADLVMANIHHAVIKSLLEVRIFRPGDRLILSGLMRSQFREVEGQLRNGFQVLKIWDHEMTWFTVLAERDYKLFQ